MKSNEKGSVARSAIKNMTLAAMFLALALLLPFVTGQIPRVGNMLLPMHIPVLLCGLICGWQYGAVVGFAAPLLRYVIFGMPIIFPTGVAMAFELMSYGLVIGLLYGRSKWKCIVALYRSLICALLAGRVVLGIANLILLGGGYSWQMFLSGALLTALPGIALQLVLIPGVMLALNKTGLVKLHRHRKPRVHAHE